MILAIDINKEVPSIYTARTMNGGMPVTDPETYDRVETAIREEALNVHPIGLILSRNAYLKSLLNWQSHRQISSCCVSA